MYKIKTTYDQRCLYTWQILLAMPANFWFLSFTCCTLMHDASEVQLLADCYCVASMLRRGIDVTRLVKSCDNNDRYHLSFDKVYLGLPRARSSVGRCKGVDSIGNWQKFPFLVKFIYFIIADQLDVTSILLQDQVQLTKRS